MADTFTWHIGQLDLKQNPVDADEVTKVTPEVV
jgi:hypothetical protein